MLTTMTDMTAAIGAAGMMLLKYRIADRPIASTHTALSARHPNPACPRLEPPKNASLQVLRSVRRGVR